jgi:stress response protein YsnF
VSTRVEEFPGRLEYDVVHEDVEVEHVPVGEVVQERVPRWEEDGVLVIPVYEERPPLPRLLTLVEHVRVRRVPVAERRVAEDTLRREQLVVEGPDDARDTAGSTA